MTEEDEYNNLSSFQKDSNFESAAIEDHTEEMQFTSNYSHFKANVQEKKEEEKQAKEGKIEQESVFQVSDPSVSFSIKYELILKEMIEIENQLNFNKILSHYNILELW
jgi:hypothetical protein